MIMDTVVYSGRSPADLKLLAATTLFFCPLHTVAHKSAQGFPLAKPWCQVPDALIDSLSCRVVLLYRVVSCRVVALAFWLGWAA